MATIGGACCPRISAGARRAPLMLRLPATHGAAWRVARQARAAADSDAHAPASAVAPMPLRVGKVTRSTKETQVEVTINLDGTGKCVADTPVHFLNHMLEQLSSHGLFDLEVHATGDTWIDDHHTVEDIALALGGALSQALGDRKGIHRFGEFSAPLDEALTHVVLDLSGRPYLGWTLPIPTEHIGTFDTQLVEHFFQSFVNTSGTTMHVSFFYMYEPGGSQRRAWDSSQLRRPAVRREFNLQLSDRFGLLEAVPPEGADAQAGYDAMAAAIREVATNHLAPRGSRWRRGWQFTLSQRTLRLMDARQRAHTAWLRSKSAAAKRERNRANRAADAAVQRDRERWIGQQVAEAQDMLRKKNLRQFARACDRLAGRSRSHQIPPAMRDVSGALHSGPDGVLKAMTESFDKLYGGETKLSDETLNQLENDVAAFELTRATEVDEAHGRPPDLAETEACVRALRSAAAPGGDQLDAMLLRGLAGRNSHHIVESTFKAFARALRRASEHDERRAGTIASSKGVLTQQ
ncbi:hypothetical protein FOA52_006296 [Chlamydomonas sp. UWO 241]|nr:hypothetical protein FOA52_006296 [Chlamydomonas sp. UWO 241]